MGADLAAVGVLHHEAQAVVCLEGVLQRLRERRWRHGRWDDGGLSAGSQETRALLIPLPALSPTALAKVMGIT